MTRAADGAQQGHAQSAGTDAGAGDTVIVSYDIRDIEAATFALAAGIDTPLIRSRLADSNARIPAQFEQLAALTIDNPVQQRRIGELKAILDRRQDVTRRLLDGGDTADFRRAAEEVVTRFPIRGMAGDIAGEELRLLSQRVATAERLRRQGEQLIWVTMAVQLLLAGLIVWMAQRQIGRRLQVESELLQASARAQSVLQTVREPIVLVDGNQRVVMHNVAFAELYSEATSDDLQGRELTSIGDGAWRDSGSVRERIARGIPPRRQSQPCRPPPVSRRSSLLPPGRVRRRSRPVPRVGDQEQRGDLRRRGQPAGRARLGRVRAHQPRLRHRAGAELPGDLEGLLDLFGLDQEDVDEDDYRWELIDALEEDDECAICDYFYNEDFYQGEVNAGLVISF